MATIAENIQRIQSAKADIKTAIEAKGVTVPSSATIDTYPTYVSQIPAGGGGDDSVLRDLIEGDITSITIPSGTTSIRSNAFSGCTSLSSVTIPNSVTSIGNSAFGVCTSLSSVTIPDGVTSIGNSAFTYCSSLTSVTIGSGITSIGQYAFYYCSSLTSIDIPDGVTSIANFTFYGCSGLTSVTIPNSVTGISASAFADCRSLTSATIGDSATSIGSRAFYNCTNLVNVTVNATTPPTLVGITAFQNTNNCPIYVPSASVETYKAASGWSTYADRIQAIPSPQPPVQCETPESTETFALDDDFDTTKAVWNLWPDNSAELDGDEMTGEEEYYFTGYVVLSEDGQSRDYTIVANLNENDDSTLDICEYDANGENFAGLVLTALTTAQGDYLYISMCDYFQKPMYVMDFSQYEVSQWQSYHAGDTVPSGVINGVRLYQNQGDGITFSGQSGTIAFEFDGSDWTATDENDPVDISGYYDSNNNTYTILFSDLGYADGMEITTPSPELEETFSFDLDLYAVTQKVNEFEVDVETEE